MATKKSAAKKVAKKAPAKKTAKPAAKKAPVKKTVKPVAKKATAKAPVKKAAKPVSKKPITKKPAKNAAKPVAKKSPISAPAKKVTKPEVKKPIAKAVVKTPKHPVVAAKPPKPHISPKAVAKNPKDIKVLPPKPVVLPKINTKSTRKYQPDFTKSILDPAKGIDLGAPIVRYSDTDLAEFRELIQRKLEAAKKELNYLQGLITRKDDMGGDETDNRYMTMEDGSLSMEREQLSQMASRQITFIDHLEKALMRIENKTYGICRITGKLIDKARLRAVPHATLSIEAKMGQVK